MSENLKLLRYNTGTDKQVFVKFKDDVSAVIFNATIVAYSSSAVADLVSVHKNQYIIDPQTHIFQHEIDAIQTTDKNGKTVVKKSVLQYLDKLPHSLNEKFFSENGNLAPSIISANLDALTESVYRFETEYVNSYIKEKEYDKYLDFAKVGPAPRVVIAPYFMLKSTYSDSMLDFWMELNRDAACKFAKINNGTYPVGIQIVLDQNILTRSSFVSKVIQSYQGIKAEYAFIWVDDFNLFDASEIQQNQFKALLQSLTKIGLKPIMAYGGYDSIILCNEELPYKLYGVAQSVGYGESRAITPVGGGLPVNKYYFPPLHKRLNMSEVLSLLMRDGYFSADSAQSADRFYAEICSCKQCRAVIKNDINRFNAYNDSIAYKIRGGITRNRPTTDASLISAMHFMYAKIEEWNFVETSSFKQLLEQLIRAYTKYDSARNCDKIITWCKIYEE